MDNCNFKTNHYSNICRACLTENSNLKSVFDFEEICEEKISLSNMLMSCASVHINQGDGLPENICVDCSRQVNIAFVFKKLCERSDTTLRLREPICNFVNRNISGISAIKSDFHVGRNDMVKIDAHDEPSYPVENSLIKEKILYRNKIDDQEDILDDRLEHDLEKTEHEQPVDCIDIKRERTIKAEKKKYACKICNKIYNSLRSFRMHMFQIHDDMVKSEKFVKKSVAKNILARHILSKHQTKSNENVDRIKKSNLSRVCDICNKAFSFHSNLERHKLIHSGEKPYLCTVCGKRFAQMAYLKIHSFIHTGEKPYECGTCDKSFTAPGTLMTHVRTHTGERPHVCKICGKKFPQSGYLAAHVRTHTGEKPVECQVCNKRFTQSGRLIVHMRIHSGEKPYRCKECGKSFAVRGTLNKHIRTHTGERPYVCASCGQRFAQSGTLATHMKVHQEKVLLRGFD